MTELPSRLIVEFKPDGIQLRALYRSPGGPGPSTRPAGGKWSSSLGPASTGP